MLPKLITFEWKFHTKQPSYILFSILFFVGGIYFGLQDGAIHADNTYNLHLFVGIVSLAAIFQIVFQTAYTVLRDLNADATQYIHTTAVGKGPFLLSRFLGIFNTAVLSSFFYVAGLLLSVVTDVFSIHPEEPIQLIHFLWPWLVVVVPNIFIISSFLFLTTIISRKVPVVFLVGFVLFASFWINNGYIGSPIGGGRLVVPQEMVDTIALTDIFGLCASHAQTQFWTPLQKSTKLVFLTGSFLYNRLLWLGVALASLLISYRCFSFRLRAQKARRVGLLKHIRRKRVQRKEKDGKKLPYLPIFTEKQSLLAHCKEFATLVKIDFQTTLFSKPFLLLALGWVAVLCMAISHNLNGQEVYGNTLPTTGLIVGLILEPLSYMGLFIMIFYAGELVWNSRGHRFNEILDSTPARNGLLLGSKYAALFLIPITLIVLAILIGLAFQFLSGYTAIDVLLYLHIFYYGGTSLLIYGILSVCIQLLSSNKYLGMLGSLIFIYGAANLLPLFGIEHPLAQLFNLPKIGEGYSSFTGFGSQEALFNKFSLLWVTVAMLVAFGSFKIFKRNSEWVLKEQLRKLVRLWNPVQRFLLVIFVLIICISAGVIEHTVRNDSALMGQSELLHFREVYEKKYKPFAKLAVPAITDIKTKVQLFPKSKSYQVIGDYTIQNITTRPIDTILITARHPLDSIVLTGARIIRKDMASIDARIVVLSPPLQAGESRQMHFKTTKKVGAFEVQRDMAQNGTYLRNSTFEPRLGYQQALEITAQSERKKRGLPPQEDPENIEKTAGKTLPKQGFETWITTDIEQIPIAPGNLLDTIQMGNRVQYHYRSTRKTDNNLSYFSAAYKKKAIQYKGITIEAYFLPEHGSNIPALLNAAVKTLEYGSKHFGDYPFDHLRIAEVPSHWKFGGHALPGTIALQERFFTQDNQDPLKGINQLTRVVIHEIGHQWFGHKLAPAPGAGGNMLNETMANYVEAQVLERIFGKTMVRQLANFNRRRYFAFRSSAEAQEPTLNKVTNETYVAYRKGFLAMQSLKELIGEKRLNYGLRSLIEHHGEAQSARAEDFLDILKATGTQEEIELITDWFENRFQYAIQGKLLGIKVNKHTHSVTLKVSAKRLQTNETGTEKEVPIDERITIGFYQKDPADPSADPYFKKVRLSKPIEEITLQLKKLPNYIVLDPMITRLDKNVQDNLIAIEHTNEH